MTTSTELTHPLTQKEITEEFNKVSIRGTKEQKIGQLDFFIKKEKDLLDVIYDKIPDDQFRQNLVKEIKQFNQKVAPDLLRTRFKGSEASERLYMANSLLA